MNFPTRFGFSAIFSTPQLHNSARFFPSLFLAVGLDLMVVVLVLFLNSITNVILEKNSTVTTINGWQKFSFVVCHTSLFPLFSCSINLILFPSLCYSVNVELKMSLEATVCLFLFSFPELFQFHIHFDIITHCTFLETFV